MRDKLEESEYWLELLGESGFVPEERLAAIKKETGELKGIFIESSATRKPRPRSENGRSYGCLSFIPLPLSLYVGLERLERSVGRTGIAEILRQTVACRLKILSDV